MGGTRDGDILEQPVGPVRRNSSLKGPFECGRIPIQLQRFVQCEKLLSVGSNGRIPCEPGHFTRDGNIRWDCKPGHETHIARVADI